MQLPIDALALMAGARVRLIRRMSALAVMIAVLQDDASKTKLICFATYFTGSRLTHAIRLEAQGSIKILA